FFQAEDGLRGPERSRGLGDVYKRQDLPGSDAASADGEATTKDGLKIGNGSLRLRQDDPGPTRESPLRDPRLNPYAPRQP
ncbi:hypothetical protein KZ844_32075, partial [Pseudomonas aeruginosa]|uniref:hypothetical protein n=1 Tax=Pseudomonas aeruginosa TaxID=287 RepID=UPI001CA53D1F